MIKKIKNLKYLALRYYTSKFYSIKIVDLNKDGHLKEMKILQHQAAMKKISKKAIQLQFTKHQKLTLLLVIQHQKLIQLIKLRHLFF